MPDATTAENKSALVFIGMREIMETPAELKRKNHREAIQIAPSTIRPE
jgi:hypothetical protein